MPTVGQWLDALTTTYRVNIVSSPTLLDEVRVKQAARINEFAAKRKPPPDMKTQLSTVPAFDPELPIDISPASLLHGLGRATTPPIPNLADLSSTWALIRYIWAFKPATGRPPHVLELSGHARGIDPHQKGVMSDDIGVAMAAYLMRNYLHTPELIDVSQAVATPSWNADLRLSTSPDYLFFDHPMGNVYVVECKGNQTSRNNSIDQLRRGTEQVPSLRLGNAQAAGSIIVATCLARCAEVFVVDPPPEDDDSFRDFVEPGGKTRRVGPRTWEVEDRRKFTLEAEGISRAKILTYAGAFAEARREIRQSVPEWHFRFMEAEADLSRVETEYGTYEGRQTRLPYYSGAQVEIFSGMDTRLKNWLGTDEALLGANNEITSATQFTRRGRGNAENQQRENIVEIPGGARFESYGEDGTAFSITVKSGA